MAEVPNYPLATKEDFDKFKNTIDAEQGWTLAHEDKKKNLIVWQQVTPESAINMVKLRAELNCPPSVVYDVLHDADYRKEWDESMEEGYCIEQLDSHNDVGYYSAKSPIFTVSARDFCNQRSWWKNPDGSEYIIFNHSVKHDKSPEKKGFIRAWSILSGYLLRPCAGNPDKTLFFYLTQCDLRGWIPTFAINQGASKFAPGIVDKLNKCSPLYTTWKASHKPDEKGWLSNEPYVWEK